MARARHTGRFPRPLLALVLVWPRIARPDQPAPPGTEVSRRLLAREAETHQLYCLWRAAGYGAHSLEAAGWVLLTASGPVVQTWPTTGRFRAQRWAGPVPANAVGIVHTHPSTSPPRPSMTDQRTAQDLGLPVTTLTRSGVFTALPDGRVVEDAGGSWFAGVRGTDSRDCP